MPRPADRRDAPEAAPASLPLRYRLPNAPPLFVGRAEETAQLAAMIRRAPVSVVLGLGGLGKTSLVLHTLHGAFPEQAARTIVVALRPAEPPAAVEVEIMRALAAAHGPGKVEWSGLLADPEALLAAVLDHAEARGGWVVLEDLHHADARSGREALAALASYARQTRWIVTSRVDPLAPELADQTLVLRGMAPSDLHELAARCAPDRPALDLRKAVEAAAGSPWRLRQILAGGEPRRAADDILRGVPAEATALIEALALLDLPLALRALEGLTPLPPPEVLDALAGRGVIERAAGGLRLHDVARPLIEPRGDLRRRKARAARALAVVDDPLAAVEALRLLLGLGRVDEAAALLEERCELMLAAGLAPRLLQLLAPMELPRFARFELRCAVELGDPAALDAARLPDPPALPDRFLWAMSRFLRGRIAETVPIASEVRRAASAVGPPAAGLAFAAGLLEAACLGEHGRAAEALSAVASLAPPGPDEAALREIHRARWLMHLGRAAEAMDTLERILGLPVDPAAPAARELRDELVVLLCYLGRIRRLEQALDALSLEAPGRGLGPAALFESRRRLLTEVMLAIHAGRLGDAAAILREVERLTRQSSYLRSFVIALDVERRLAAGELEGAEGLLQVLHAEASRAGHAHNRSFAFATATRLAILRGGAPVDLGPAPPMTPFWEAVHAAGARLHAILHGAPPPPAPPHAEDIVHGRVVLALGAAAAQILAGDPEAALVHAATAHASAREHGHVPAELEALRGLCDALLCAGDDVELARAAELLEARAEAAGSRRFAGEGRWFQVTLGGAPHPAALEPLCALADVAPVAARRARALLGEPAALDLLDRAALEALDRRACRPSVRRVAEAAREAPERAGWGLDTAARRAWLPGGRAVDLATRPLLFRVLLAIAERGGRATKEELVLSAWAQRDYHPMRDDKRLHVAIRKLRLLLEDDPARPARLMTTPEGYAFGEGEPFRLLEAPGAGRGGAG